jgi:beta-lactam-binding protein with PASTA domain
VYDEEQYQYAPPPKSPIPAAVLTSLITTILVFAGLRLLEDRGLFGKGHAGTAVEVPSVLGMKPDQARDLLQARDLVVSLAGERPDPKAIPGAIVAQAPPPGTQAARGTGVQVTIAAAATAGQVPNVIGARGEDALRQLAAAGLQVGERKTTASTTIPAGSVVQTEPPAGASVAPGTPVALVLSSGSPATNVPKVTGMRMSRARKTLEDAGFVVGHVRTGADDDKMGGVILKQDPPAGTATAPGTAIDVVVNED